MGRRGSTTRGQRDASDSSLDDLLAPEPWPSLVSPLPSEFMDPLSVLSEISDARMFTPDRATRPSLDLSGNVAPTRRIPATDKRWASIGYDNPDLAVVCARRKSRREVLFAKRRRRRGGGGSRRRTWWSNVKC